jgi:hypothetical protein
MLTALHQVIGASGGRMEQGWIGFVSASNQTALGANQYADSFSLASKARLAAATSRSGTAAGQLLTYRALRL